MTQLVRKGLADKRFKRYGIVLIPFEVRGPSLEGGSEGPLLDVVWAVSDGGRQCGQGPITTELSALQYALKVQEQDVTEEMARLVEANEKAILAELMVDEDAWKAERLEEYLADLQPQPTLARGLGRGP